jgi:hypothetical protein
MIKKEVKLWEFIQQPTLGMIVALPMSIIAIFNFYWMFAIPVFGAFTGLLVGIGMGYSKYLKAKKAYAGK